MRLNLMIVHFSARKKNAYLRIQLIK